MEAKHTKGPWWLESEFTVLDEKHDRIADIAANTRMGYDTASANARLVASAPELLEACEAALLTWDEEPVDLGATARTRNLVVSAIKKAIG